jgi:hypothetical protein
MSKSHLITRLFPRRFVSFTLIACCWFNFAIPAFGASHTRPVVKGHARALATGKTASAPLMTNANPERAAAARKAMSELPVTFEAGVESKDTGAENTARASAIAKETAPGRASFVARANSYTLSILPTEAIFRFRPAERRKRRMRSEARLPLRPLCKKRAAGCV